MSTSLSSGFSPFETSITAIFRDDADLRRRQAHALGGVHRFEHVLEELVQLRRVELGHVRRLRAPARGRRISRSDKPYAQKFFTCSM